MGGVGGGWFRGGSCSRVVLDDQGERRGDPASSRSKGGWLGGDPLRGIHSALRACCLLYEAKELTGLLARWTRGLEPLERESSLSHLVHLAPLWIAFAAPQGPSLTLNPAPLGSPCICAPLRTPCDRSPGLGSRGTAGERSVCVSVSAPRSPLPSPLIRLRKGSPAIRAPRHHRGLGDTKHRTQGSALALEMETPRPLLRISTRRSDLPILPDRSPAHNQRGEVFGAPHR